VAARRRVDADALRSLVRWCLVGALFTALTVPTLYLFREVLGLPLWAASLLTWELGNLLRFLVNDRWVFGRCRPSWQRLWTYHAAAASSFVIWWGAINVLPRAGVHYLIASILATGCSVTWSVATNFLWVWRRPGRTDATAHAAGRPVVTALCEPPSALGS
jgi:dolichol-phosphate mannosyltransferase